MGDPGVRGSENLSPPPVPGARLATPREPSPERAVLILRELGWQPVRDGAWWRAACAACAGVVALPRDRPTWAIGDAVVTVFDRGRPPSATNLLCACGDADCPHVAATLLVLAYNDPVRRPAFDAPLWAVALAPLVPGAGAAPATSPRAGVRYVLEPPDAAGRLVIRPELVGPGRAPYPASRERLVAIARVDEADLAFHDAWVALEGVRRRLRAPPGPSFTLALLDPLARTGRATFAGRSVAIAPAPVAPRLVARPAGDDLALAWEPALGVVWSEGFALTRDDVFIRLAEHVPTAVRQRLADPLPVVPAGDVARFVADYAGALGVILPPGLAPPPPAPESRVVLSEDGSALRVSLELIGGDPAWRAAEQARFDAEVGDRLLPFAAAWAWLRDVLPTLRGRWVIYGEGGLARLRLRGALAPSVRVRSAADGWHLDAAFTVDGREVPAVPVLASWLAGEKYLRLDDGTLAELPAAWLERHGRALEDLTRAKRLGAWHAWEASEVAETPAAFTAWTDQWKAGIPDLAPPASLRAALRPYQRAGQSWLRFLAAHGLAGVLADEMGLGKTLQALAALAATPGPHLVIAPTSVLGVWVDEIARFTALRASLYHGTDRALADTDVVITSYGVLRRDPALRSREWVWVVLDEAQAIKQPGSQTARAARALRSRHRVALTGTPLENDLTELWSLFAFLQPGFLGSRRAFHARVAGPASRDPHAPVLARLRHRLAPFVLRRRKVEVAPELPPRTEVVQRVALTAEERRLYERIRATWRASDGLLHRLAVLTRLRQACCHAGLLPFPEAREVARSSKVRAALDRLREAVAGGHKALVFSQWPSLLHRVGEALAAEGIGHLVLEGRTVGRAALVSRFQAPDGPPVFLISTTAGGTGLTLTAADVVLHLDPWWNPAIEDQATSRAHRIGQTRPVTVYRLVAEDTVEDRVLALQGRKRALFDATLDGDGLLPDLDEAEWAALF